MLLQSDELGDLSPAVISALRDADEKRTEITGTAASAQNNTWLGRLLADSEGAYLRATYPSVGPGRHTYPIVTGTTVADDYARGAAETPAGGLSTEDADPTRIQHTYEISSVDELVMPGIGAYLARDLRASLMSGLDKETVSGLNSELTDTDLGAATLTTAILLAGVHGLVDGRGAFYYTDIRLLAGNTAAASQTTAHTRLGALLAAATFDGIFNWLGDIRASAHMPAAAAGEDNILAIKMRGSVPRLIVPVWRRGQLLRDTGRGQLSGTITLTGIMFADVIVASSDLHTRWSVETQ